MKHRLLLQFLIVFSVLSVVCPTANADVIYLNDGNVLMVSKAWVEGEEVKYETRRGIQSLPRTSVKEIRQDKPTASAGPQRWSLGVVVGGSAPSIPDTSGGATSSGNELSIGALARLRENLRADPSDSQAKAQLIGALNSVASLQVTQGDLPGARVTLDEARGLDGRNPIILSNLAVIHMQMGNHGAAQGLLETCLQIDRDNQDTHYLLGEAYYAQEKISQAINQWTTGLRLGPHPEMSRSLDKAKQEAEVHDDLGTLQSPHFLLRYDRKVSDQQLGQQILTTLEQLYTRLTTELMSRPPATIAVILYPDQTYFDITRAASWSGALFDGKIRVPTRGLTRVTPELTATLTHELTHSFISGLPGSGCPAWFNEGVAQLSEGESANGDRKALDRLRLANQLIPLKNLERSFIDLPAAAADVAYTESLSAVEYMVTLFGRSSIRNILELMARNYNFENAFKTALKQGVPEFESGWHLDLAR